MPFYEYQCSACGHHHEELQKVTDRPLRKCPACGRATLKRLVSAPVFRLKGGGWYETDFKNDKESKRNLAGEKEPATGDASAEKRCAPTSRHQSATRRAQGEPSQGRGVRLDKCTRSICCSRRLPQRHFCAGGDGARFPVAPAVQELRVGTDERPIRRACGVGPAL